MTDVANAEQPLVASIMQGKPVIDLRLRYEGVDDDKFPLKDADAITVRARLGYDTGYWNGFSLGFDFDQIWALGKDNFNSTRNGRSIYPVVADPNMTVLNRLQLTYASDFDTKFIIGRQRLLFGNQRFIGNAGWRQHEQTFDAATLVNTSIDDLTFTYSYLNRINRVFGPDDPNPATPTSAAWGTFNSNSHLFNAVYVGVPDLRLEAYGYLLKLSQRVAVAATSKLSTATFGARGEYHVDLSDLADDLAGQVNGEFAHQSNYAGNPLSLSLNYWLAEGSLTYAGITGLLGYESLGGNGTVGFSTPLATLHAFNGWADIFLKTPANGLDDLYFKASYVIAPLADALDFKAVTASVIYHNYTTENLGLGLGSEWDAALDVAVDKNASFLAKYAAYQGNAAIASLGGNPDKRIMWLQAAYKY